MGCANSKQQVCQNCHSPYSPSRRSHSLEWDRPPQREAESHHVVALTSSTLGSLLLDPSVQNQIHCEEEEEDGEEFLVEKKTLKTPEPETINAWELMKDLEDCGHARSLSFRVSPNHWSEVADEESNSTSGSNDTSIGLASEFDPEMIATFRKALAELPPAATPFLLSPLVRDDKETGEAIIERRNRVIFYFTSLRAVRKTYEDCCYVRTILNGLGVKVEERDVSMHSGFKEEVKELFGGGGLPRVFVGEKYIGGADEIRRMNEEGQLEKLVEGCERVEEGGVCEACGDIRFVPCERCSGSCKIYCEFGDEDVDEFGFQRCPDCNENGLITCPICWY